jgi:hypothetical protein
VKGSIRKGGKRIAEAPSLFSARHPPNGPTANILAGFAPTADISVQPKRPVILMPPPGIKRWCNLRGAQVTPSLQRILNLYNDAMTSDEQRDQHAAKSVLHEDDPELEREYRMLARLLIDAHLAKLRQQRKPNPQGGD